METRTEKKTGESEARIDRELGLKSASSELTPEERAVLKYDNEHIYRPMLLESMRKSIQRSMAAYSDKGEIHPALRAGK